MSHDTIDEKDPLPLPSVMERRAAALMVVAIGVTVGLAALIAIRLLVEINAIGSCGAV
jgi:hypothetical protein